MYGGGPSQPQRRPEGCWVVANVHSQCLRSGHFFARHFSGLVPLDGLKHGCSPLDQDRERPVEEVGRNPGDLFPCLPELRPPTREHRQESAESVKKRTTNI